MEMTTIGALTTPNAGLSAAYQTAAVPQGAETGAQGHAAPAESRSQAVQTRAAREAEQEPRNPAPQLLAQQTATEVSRLAMAQADSLRQLRSDTDPNTREGQSELQLKAVRAYEASTQVLEEAKALIDRIVLLPEKGDLSLEASQMPPYGPPRFEAPTESQSLVQDMAEEVTAR